MHQPRRRQQPASATDGQYYLSGELAYLIQGWTPIPAQPSLVLGDDVGPSTEGQGAPSGAPFPRTALRESGIRQPLHVGTQQEVAHEATAHASDERGSPHALAEVWSRVQAGLAQRVSSPDMETWITPTVLAALDTEQAVIETPHTFARDTVATTYRDMIAEVLQQVTGTRYTVEVVIGNRMNSTY